MVGDKIIVMKKIDEIIEKLREDEAKKINKSLPELTELYWISSKIKSFYGIFLKINSNMEVTFR